MPRTRATEEPLRRVVDLDIGERAMVGLADGSTATVRLLSVESVVDGIRHAVRRSDVTVEVNGERATLTSANYRLPVAVGGVQIDCPITAAYIDTTHRDPWGLKTAARLRLWPAGSPWIEPGTFGYPARQRWFATDTQMANEPVFVNACERPEVTAIYYHNGLDIGGADGLVQVVAATDALVVCRGEEVLQGHQDSPVRPRYDLLYLLDDRGWYYRYSHLDSIDSAVRAGERVVRGQPLGILGKEGASGGWSHLHFDITAPQPSGEWGTEEGYAYLWQAYLAEYRPAVIAVARPHHLARVGEPVVLDGGRSWCVAGRAGMTWTCTDGLTADGPVLERTYVEPGVYSEILRVEDAAGRVAYDFAVVEIHGTEPEDQPPSIHAVYAPTIGLRAGDAVTFLVRTFRSARRGERWDFGDGSAPVTVASDGNAEPHYRFGYARCVHRYVEPGDYLASVEHVNERGYRAVGRVHVHVDAA